MRAVVVPTAPHVARRACASRQCAPTARRVPQCHRCGGPVMVSSSGVSALWTPHRALARSAARRCTASSSSLFASMSAEGQARNSTAERRSDRQPGTDAASRTSDVDAADVDAELEDVDGSGPSSSSTSDGVPRVEPASAAARAALAARRALFARSTALAEVVHAELHAEVARDVTDGVAAVPPLAPPGWRVVHSAGTSFFTMSRVLRGGYVERGVGRSGAGGASTGTASPDADAQPRYRSVHDMMMGGGGGGARRAAGDETPTGGRTHRRAEATTRDLWVLHRGRYAAEEATAAAQTTLEQSAGGGSRPAQRAPCVARSDTHVTLFAPFRTLDLTLFDPRVDICEWTRFDVLVRKVRPASPSTLSPVATPLEGQQAVWDEGRCLFARLACVNGEPRLRAVQFVSNRLARALEEHAVFGKGEPLYLELLRRLPVVEAETGRGRRARTAGRSSPSSPPLSSVHVSAASPVHFYDAPTPVRATAVTPPPLPRTSAGVDAASVLTAQFDRNGEYARTFAYGGPYLTELSKELREALAEYVMMDLGITNEVAEYVCQLQYFLEQEEYVAWLAQWGQLASTLQRTL